MSGVLPQKIISEVPKSGNREIDITYDELWRVKRFTKRVPVITTIRDAVMDATDELNINTSPDMVENTIYQFVGFKEVKP